MELLTWIPEAKDSARFALDVYHGLQDRIARDIPNFGNFRSLFVGLVAEDGALEYYGGSLRIMDGTGNIIADRLELRGTTARISERQLKSGRISSSASQRT